MTGRTKARVGRIRLCDRLRDPRTMHRAPLTPWLGHPMVAVRETARPLLTPGEIMQLPATDEIVMVPAPAYPRQGALLRGRGFRAHPAPHPTLTTPLAPIRTADDWPAAPRRQAGPGATGTRGSDQIRREPELPLSDRRSRRPAAVPSGVRSPGRQPEDDARQSAPNQMTGASPARSRSMTAST